MSPLRFSLLHLTLAAALLLPACKSVRTVYDEGGNIVKESEHEGANETDLVSAFEKRFDASFSEKRNAQGVPESTSQRVSSFQKELDKARSSDDDRYGTKIFGGSRRNESFSGRYETKSYGERKEYDARGTSSRYSTDMRPDFMNENRGLAHKDYQGGEYARYSGEGTYSSEAGRTYATHASSYHHSQESGYFESHRHDTPAPPIFDHKDVQTREIMNIRNILGRDKTDAE